ncbi:MAG: LpqB family beta-propeller domain-containing protein, partial [Longimicrobiales bacterium]
EIYVMNADGSGQTNLTMDPGDDDSPAWSPDGSMIAFVSDRTGDRQVYVMMADGSGQTALTEQTGSSPLWQPRSN